MEPETEIKPTWAWRAICGAWTGIIATIVVSVSDARHWDLTLGLFVLSGALAGSLCLAHYTQRVVYGWKTRLFLAALGGFFTYLLLALLFSLAVATTHIVSGESHATLEAFLQAFSTVLFFTGFGIVSSPVWIGSALALEGTALLWERFIDQRIFT